MRTVAGWVVGASVALAGVNAFGEAGPPQAPPPQQAAPQPQAVAPPQPQPAPQPKTDPKKRAPTQAKAAPKQPAQVPKTGDATPAPRASTCKVTPVKGTPIFEARYASGKKAVITRLYASGTYTRVVLKQSPQRSACIEKEPLDLIRKGLAESKWQATKSPSTCIASSAETTEIYAGGKLRFTSRECNPLVLDQDSSQALAYISYYVGPFGLDLADELR